MTETIEALKKEIIRCLRPMNPEKVILFGSHAAGTAPLCQGSCHLRLSIMRQTQTKTI